MRRIAAIFFLSAGLSACQPELQSTITLSGQAQGTTYTISYTAGAYSNYRTEIDSIFAAIDQSLSTWQQGSLIMRINQNATDTTDAHLEAVLRKALEVARITEGAFDPTVGPLIQAYGFGLAKKEQLTPTQIDSLRQLIGYRQIQLLPGKVQKARAALQLDVNAIAPGYTVDVLATFLQQKGIRNYLMELGGEVRAAGNKLDGRPWMLGIELPTETEAEGPRLHGIIPLHNISLATSGNYKNFYEENGKKYSHIIDPATGYPARHSLLSTTVTAPDCISADAYATAFMVMGMARAQAFMQQHPELQLQAAFIYDSLGKVRSWQSEKFPPQQ